MVIKGFKETHFISVNKSRVARAQRVDPNSCLTCLPFCSVRLLVWRTAGDPSKQEQGTNALITLGQHLNRRHNVNY